MRIRTGFVCLFVCALAVSCSKQAPKHADPPDKPSPMPAGWDDWGATTQDPPLKVKVASMDKVLQHVDQRVDQARYARLGYSYRSRRRPPGVDKTLAPYFHIPGKSGATTEELPLKATSARVLIAGVIAQVTVRQVYQNRGKTPIEAVYVFPGSTRAAVHGMRMKIGKRIIEAKIKERDAARKAYNAARNAGKRASLLEQQRPNVFTMNVANIMPGDKIQVELNYSELLVPEDGTYSFVYPTVVGPRFPGGADKKADSWIANPYLKSGKKEPYAFDIHVKVQSGIGIKALTSPSHKVDVKWASRKSADVTLARKGGGNRDYVLNYRLAGDKIETGVMTFDSGKEKFFLVMMEPPKRVTRKQMPRREYIFVLDVSGSMYGFPMKTSKALIRRLLKNLRPTDLFNVLLFAGAASVMHPQSVPATPANVQAAITSIDQRRGGGGTQLMQALRTAYSLKRPALRGISRSIVVLTDGYVAVEAQAFRFIRKHLHEANVFAFGIGGSVNRAIIEGMARAGMGTPFVVLDPNRAPAKAEKFHKYISAPVLTDIRVAHTGLKLYDVVPKSPPDLMAQRPLVLFGKIRGEGKGFLQVSGTTGQGAFKSTLGLDTSLAKPTNKPIRVLWARKWAQMLMDQYAVLGGDDEVKKAVTNLGLGYNLLTRFTSFVAVDSKVVRKNGKLVKVTQPLPLPKGVSNYALPGSGPRSSSRRYRRRASSGWFGGGGGAALQGIAASPSTSAAERAPARPAPRRELKSKDADGPADGLSKKPRGRYVVSLGNVTSAKQARVRSLAVAAARKCLRGVSAVTVRITIDRRGKVTVTGVSGSQARCIRSRLTLLVRYLNHSHAGWRAAGRTTVIRIRIR